MVTNFKTTFLSNIDRNRFPPKNPAHVSLRDAFDHDKAQGTEICNFGAPSPLVLLEFSPVDFFHFLQGFLFNLVRKSPQNVEKNCPIPRWRKKRRIMSRLWLSCFFFSPDSRSKTSNFITMNFWDCSCTTTATHATKVKDEQLSLCCLSSLPLFPFDAEGDAFLA